MDGTLLGEHGRLPPRCAVAIRRLASQGLKIILASGRMTARIIPYAVELDIPMTLVSFNGAEISEGRGQNWKTLLSREISGTTRDAVFQRCRDAAVFLNVYAGGKLYGYHASGDFTYSRHYETQTGADYAGLYQTFDALPQSEITKLLVIETPEARDRLFEAWNPSLSAHCEIMKSNPEYLEFLDRGITKGSALAFCLTRFGIDSKHLIAFGDAENDLEMLRLAGLGIAMGNATPGLRDVFPRISKWTHREEGIARELESLYQ